MDSNFKHIRFIYYLELQESDILYELFVIFSLHSLSNVYCVFWVYLVLLSDLYHGIGVGLVAEYDLVFVLVIITYYNVIIFSILLVCTYSIYTTLLHNL